MTVLDDSTDGRLVGTTGWLFGGSGVVWGSRVGFVVGLESFGGLESGLWWVWSRVWKPLWPI